MEPFLNWDKIKDTIEKEPWAHAFMEELRPQVDTFIAEYRDDVNRKPGWFHDYNCNKCSGRLIFDPHSPDKHKCGVCGEWNEGEKLDRYWYNAYRGRANSYAQHAGLLYRLEGDDAYPFYMKRLLDFYADNYDNFVSEAVAKRFEGKLMNQHLDDASSIISIILGILFMKDCFSPEEMDDYYERLFRREAELFDFFATRIYNIPVWIRCAQAIIGVAFDKQEQIRSAFFDKYGVMDQLRKGVTPEGLWYEGSMHYHFYTIQPLCFLLIACRLKSFKLPELAEIEAALHRMFSYPVSMLFRNRKLPNTNDGHPDCSIDRYIHHYEYACGLFDDPVFRQICDTHYTASESCASLPRLLFHGNHTAVAFMPDACSVNNPESYTAMLRSKNVEVAIKYGVHTHLHLHPDIMNIDLAFDNDLVAADIGNGGYASWLFREWQRHSAAHNTVVVNQKDQLGYFLPAGMALEFDPESAYIKARSKGIMDAVNFTRELRAGDLQLSDTFTVDGRGEYVFDWFFHCCGDLRCMYDTEPVESVGDRDGYQHLFDIRRFITDDEWVAEFVLPDKIVLVTMQGAPGTEVHLLNSYIDSTEHTRCGLMVRRHAESTVFKTEYSCRKM